MISEVLLFVCSMFVLIAALVLTIKTRCVQLRMLPKMFSLLLEAFGKQSEDPHKIKAHHALFTAMSTTIGIATIVGPVIAIRMGGPGSVIGLVVGTVLGTAVNYSEVCLAIKYRKQCLQTNRLCGGPMQYLSEGISSKMGAVYAFFAMILLFGWSAAQTNQLCAILSSPLLEGFSVPTYVTSPLIGLTVIALLIGGIQRVSNFAAKLVPFMFLLYLAAGSWILVFNYEKIPALCGLIFQTAFQPMTLATGVCIGGILSSMRWGVLKAIQTSEAGFGTQAIPHSSADCDDAESQGILSMASTYSAGFICVLSSFIALLTETWIDPHLNLGIEMIAASFSLYFAKWGVIVVALSSVLFAYGTILGNSYNGLECFLHLFKQQKRLKYYYFFVGAAVMAGGFLNVRFVWTAVDYLIIPVLIPHLFGLLYLTFKKEPVLDLAVQPSV